MDKKDILSMDKEELKSFVRDMGEASYRSGQIFRALHGRMSESFSDMTDLSLKLREKLSSQAAIKGVRLIKKYRSSIDRTIKYLFEIENGYIIESVLMEYEYGYSVCISTQAGCRMGCSFCASTIGGLERNLTAGEMLSEIYAIEREEGIRVGRAVLMGCGEPLDNFDNVIRFIELISDPEGNNIGKRHITLSTCGLTEGIERLEKLKLPITLAVSLHAPNDRIRKTIMPVAYRYGYGDVIKAAAHYADATKRRVTFEYALIDGINDRSRDAEELAHRLKGTMAHVNLIPVNSVKEKDYRRSSDKKIREFSRILSENNIENTIRRKLGSDINAACGQLRKSYSEKKGAL